MYVVLWTGVDSETGACNALIVRGRVFATLTAAVHVAKEYAIEYELMEEGEVFDQSSVVFNEKGYYTVLEYGEHPDGGALYIVQLASG